MAMDALYEIKNFRNIMQRIFEDDAVAVSDVPNTPDASADQPGSVDQTADDNDIQSMMTTPSDDEDAGDSDVDTIALDLNVANPSQFSSAFDNLKNGSSLDSNQQSALIAALSGLLSADASTAQRAINQLRTLYKIQ
jgi:hypothetical protein